MDQDFTRIHPFAEPLGYETTGKFAEASDGIVWACRHGGENFSGVYFASTRMEPAFQCLIVCSIRWLFLWVISEGTEESLLELILAIRKSIQ